MLIEGGSVCVSAAGGWACLTWPVALVYLGSVVVLLAVVLGVLVWDARRTPTPSQSTLRANRHATLASVVGVAVMVVLLTWLFTGVALVASGRDGRVVATLPALAGASLLVAQAVGQLTWPRPSGMLREAELARRTVADVAPLVPRRLVFAWAGAALLLLVVFGLVADGPRTLTREASRYTEAIGPYPGWYYGLPMGLAIVVTVVATELVLRLITLRPAVVGVSAEWDLHLRRRSARHTTRGVQLVLAVTTAGILVAAGWAHLELGQDWVHLSSGGYAASGSQPQAYLGSGLLMLAAAVLLTSLVVTIVPEHRGRRDQPVPVGVAVPS